MPFVGEGVFRLIFDKADYLLPLLVKDPVFGVRPFPLSTGHDAWSFRNSKIPSQTEIMAIGDSMTYGYSAPRFLSYPAQLEKITGSTVYNAGNGGWSMVQYFCAFKKFAPKLDPKIIIFGLYFGNDIRESYHYRNLKCDDSLDKNVFLVKVDDYEPSRLFGKHRSWLSKNSVFYQVVKMNFEKIASIVRLKLSQKQQLLVFGSGNTKVVFSKYNVGALNIENQQISLGLEIIKNKIKEINPLCDAKKIKCYLLLIPSKRLVHKNTIELAKKKEGYTLLKTEIEAEIAVRTQVISFAKALSFSFIDPLSALQAVIGYKKIFPHTEDIHFNGSGYGVIAEVISNRLKKD
jgi:hypothetical protein